MYNVGIMIDRNEKGMFVSSGGATKSVRSFRISDEHYEKIKEMSDEMDISRGILLEMMIDEKRSEPLPLIQEINKGTEEKIKEIIEGLKKGGDNQLDIPIKERAIVRRGLEALIEYLKNPCTTMDKTAKIEQEWLEYLK